MPAIWTNLGGDHLASTAANWSYGWGESPGHITSAQFTAPYSDDCVGLAGSFDAVELDDTYGGTVTTGGALAADSVNVRGGVLSLNGPLTAEWLSQDAGTIDQPLGDDSAITVTQVWSWAGGTLNSTATPSSITVDGSVYGCATATLLPMGAMMTGSGSGPKTVYCGSSIVLTGGAIMTCGAGTITVLNSNQEIDIEDGCGMAVDPGENGALIEVAPEYDLNVERTPTLNLFGGGQPGWLELRRGAYLYRGAINNAGGRVTLFAETNLAVSGRRSSDEAFTQTRGVTELYGGSVLQIAAEKEFQLHDGVLRTLANTNGSADAFVVSDQFLFLGGAIEIGAGGMTHTFGTLTVTGDVRWDNGTYRPVVQQPDSLGQTDLWRVVGNITVNGGAISPTALVMCGGFGPDPGVPVDGTWSILEATGSITSNAPVEVASGWFLHELGENGSINEWAITGL